MLRTQCIHKSLICFPVGMNFHSGLFWIFRMNRYRKLFGCYEMTNGEKWLRIELNFTELPKHFPNMRQLLCVFFFLLFSLSTAHTKKRFLSRHFSFRGTKNLNEWVRDRMKRKTYFEMGKLCLLCKRLVNQMMLFLFL